MLAGEIELRVGERTVRCAAGAFVHVLPGVVHGFHNPGPDPAKLLILVHPTAGFGQWVDRIDWSPGSAQTGHQQPERSLDRDWDRMFGVIALLREQFERVLIASCVIRTASSGQQGASLVNAGDVAMVLRPLNPTEHWHLESSPLLSVCASNEPGTDVGALVAGLQARHPISRSCRPQPAGPLGPGWLGEGGGAGEARHGRHATPVGTLSRYRLSVDSSAGPA
ncbi:MAG: cupin domain-containing protein [Chloroflexota bacterium]